MIQIFRKSSSSPELAVKTGPKEGCWLNITNPSKDEITNISEFLKIDEKLIKGILDEEEQPRVEKEDGLLFVVIRVPKIGEKGDLTIIPLEIIVMDDYIITLMSDTNQVIDDFINNKVKNFYTTKKTRFLMQIFARTNKHYKRYLDHVEKRIEESEKSIMKSFKNEEIVGLLNLQKDLLFMSTAVVSNEKALNKILNGRVIRFYKGDRDLLEDIVIENKESIEMVNIYSNILSNTLDAYASLVSNNLNVVMKFLASVTIILAIPSIVSGIYGMNIGLPFQTNPYAFWFVITTMVLLMVVAVLVFVKKKYF